MVDRGTIEEVSGADYDGIEMALVHVHIFTHLQKIIGGLGKYAYTPDRL